MTCPRCSRPVFVLFSRKGTPRVAAHLCVIIGVPGDWEIVTTRERALELFGWGALGSKCPLPFQVRVSGKEKAPKG